LLRRCAPRNDSTPVSPSCGALQLQMASVI
jgi:hypothetical protein